VQARSDGPGKGSEFIVRLPLVVEQAEPAPHPDAAPPLAKVLPRRVLIVDDNRDAAESLAMLLGLMGLTTRVANGGHAALEALPAFKPSLVFLDIGMPDMDGHEVARHVRALPEWQHLILVAMTGWGQDEDRRRSHAAGFDHHLIKPVDIRALEALLRSLDATGTIPRASPLPATRGEG
jgi:CheY-like chemotaxis protein